MKHVGNTLKELRENSGYSLEEIAVVLHTHESIIDAYENGEILIRLDELEKLATLYNCQTHDILKKAPIAYIPPDSTQHIWNNLETSLTE